MTGTRLPAIKITCRNGHTFFTRAKGNQSINCQIKTCRVPIHVPTDRPISEAEVNAKTREYVKFSRENQQSILVDRWDKEEPFSGSLIMRDDYEGENGCIECDSVLVWEGGRTLLYCQICSVSILPPTIAKYYEKTEARRTQVTRMSDQEAATKTLLARMELDEKRDQAILVAEQVLDYIQPENFVRTETVALAQSYGSNLRSLVYGLHKAETLAELNACTDLLNRLLREINSNRVVLDWEHSQTSIESGTADTEYQDEYKDEETEYIPPRIATTMQQLPSLSPQSRIIRSAPARNTNSVRISNIRNPRTLKTNCEFGHVFACVATHEVWATDKPGGPRYGDNVPIKQCCNKHLQDAIDAVKINGWTCATYRKLD